VLGQPIEVISGREEGAPHLRRRRAPAAVGQPRLVVDIGGRSTEMILGHGRKPLRAESFQVGSVSLSLRYFGDGRFTEEAFARRRSRPAPSSKRRSNRSASVHWQEALGSSGTVGAVSQLLAAAA
jgi:exopolyphosphatase/guanosine-5'-triphosphate,3'-diphosphate pyrophosphatase